MASRICAICLAFISLWGIVIRIGGTAGLSIAKVLQQLFDAVLMPDTLVEGEQNLRRPAQPQPLADLPAHESCGPIERARRVLARRRIAEAGVEHPGMLEIGAHLNAGHRHEADPGIVQLARNHRRDLGADLVGDTIWSGSLSHGLYADTAIRSTVK